MLPLLGNATHILVFGKCLDSNSWQLPRQSGAQPTSLLILLPRNFLIIFLFKFIRMRNVFILGWSSPPKKNFKNVTSKHTVNPHQRICRVRPDPELRPPHSPRGWSRSRSRSSWSRWFSSYEGHPAKMAEAGSPWKKSGVFILNFQ